MYNISYDKAKNLVIVVIEEVPYGEELEKYSNDLINAINSTRQGFDIVFDFSKSKAKVVTDEDAKGIKGLKQYCIQKGLRKSVFVISSVTLKMQFSRVLKDMEPEDSYFNTIEEALSYINV